MSKRTLVAVVAVAVCAILAAGGLLASNMGFKLNYQLSPTGPGVASGKNTLSLPYFRQTGVDNVLQLMQDIGGGAITPVLNVQKFNISTDLFQTYTGRMSPAGQIGTAYALTPGEGYLVQMASAVNYIVVGSHDPALSYQLRATGGGSQSGKNFYAPPYNITSANSLQLMQDIGGGVITPVLNVQKFNKATDLFQTYTGRMSPAGQLGTPFAIVPGEAYLVQMSTTVPYIASHY